MTRAGMESTSDYWKPVFFLLEQQGFDCVLYQASKVKAQPGRPKTDKLDSVWLAKVTECGSVAGSFVLLHCRGQVAVLVRVVPRGVRAGGRMAGVPPVTPFRPWPLRGRGSVWRWEP